MFSRSREGMTRQWIDGSFTKLYAINAAPVEDGNENLNAMHSHSWLRTKRRRRRNQIRKHTENRNAFCFSFCFVSVFCFHPLSLSLIYTHISLLYLWIRRRICPFVCVSWCSCFLFCLFSRVNICVLLSQPNAPEMAMSFRTVWNGTIMHLVCQQRSNELENGISIWPNTRMEKERGSLRRCERGTVLEGVQWTMNLEIMQILLQPKTWIEKQDFT